MVRFKAQRQPFTWPLRLISGMKTFQSCQRQDNCPLSKTNPEQMSTRPLGSSISLRELFLLCESGWTFLEKRVDRLTVVRCFASDLLTCSFELQSIGQTQLRNLIH